LHILPPTKSFVGGSALDIFGVKNKIIKITINNDFLYFMRVKQNLHLKDKVLGYAA
jgi:hypothetical protein